MKGIQRDVTKKRKPNHGKYGASQRQQEGAAAFTKRAVGRWAAAPGSGSENEHTEAEVYAAGAGGSNLSPHCTSVIRNGTGEPHRR